MNYLFVDGHSVIFQWPELCLLHQQRMELAREELIRQLTQYQDSTGRLVVLVFDGKGEKVSEEKRGIQIFYARSGGTADDIIERLAAKYGADDDILVITSDRAIQQTAVSFNARWQDCESLRSLLAEAERDLSRKVRDHNRRNAS